MMIKWVRYPGKLQGIALALYSLFSVSNVHANLPSTPTSLEVAIYSSTAAEVVWTRSSDDVIVIGYELSLNGQVLGVFDQLSYWRSDLTEGDTYTLSIVAIDNEGNRSEANSIDFVAGKRAETPPTDPTDPMLPDDAGAIQGLQIVRYSRTAAELFWQRPTGSVSTQILRDGVVLGQAVGNSYYDGNRVRNVDHAYELNALDRNGTVITTGRIGGSVEQPNPNPNPKTSTLENLVFERYSSRTGELFWDKAANGVSTRVTRDGVFIGSTPGNSFYDDTRQRNTLYRYELSTLDANGQTVATASLDEGGTQSPEQPPEQPPIFEPTSTDIKPDRSIYLEGGYDPVNVIRVDLKTATTLGVCVADDISGCTLQDVLEDVDKKDDLKVDIAVHFSSDDFADDGSVNNAELRLRGGGSRLADQKSFRIKLDSKKDLWRDERYLQLNKHPYESSRMRNKLAMDLMARVPNLPSFRTQFVNLWIDDGEGPEDYGLFTHVERINDDYLKARDLDKDGNLYKAENFRFDSSDINALRIDSDGKPEDKDIFESTLSIEEGKDHRPLLAMLQALNDPQRDFESVIDEYFNRNNLLAWMAVNILFKQDDATRHNFILYNPSETSRFYLLPWDYDATLGTWRLPDNNAHDNDSLKRRAKYGYALAARNVLLEKFYRLPCMHEQLLQTVDLLRQTYIDDATVVNLSEHNLSLVEDFQTRLPDAEFNPDYVDAVFFDNSLRNNAKALREAFSLPIPPTLLEPERVGTDWEISWQQAYDPTGSTISYDLQVSVQPDFATDDIVFEATGIHGESETLSQLIDSEALPFDEFFVRLIARSSTDPDRFWVAARNLAEEGSERFYGVIKVVAD